MKVKQAMKAAPLGSRVALAACGYFLGSALRSLYALGWTDGVEHMQPVSIDACELARQQERERIADDIDRLAAQRNPSDSAEYNRHRSTIYANVAARIRNPDLYAGVARAAGIDPGQ